MTPEQLKAREEKLAKRAEMDEKHWAKEKAEGEEFYTKIQAELAKVEG